MIGLLLALAAIWMIASGEGGGGVSRIRWGDIRLPLIAGVVFGLYFVLMHQASQRAVMYPIISARLASILILSIFALWTRQLQLPSQKFWLPIVITGVLDTGGNALYVLAGQLGRLDVAAVLGSLYPGATVALAWLILKERVRLVQALGISAALVAIILVTL
jgi:drug/metabolite transporter (DMT)-like permease